MQTGRKLGSGVPVRLRVQHALRAAGGDGGGCWPVALPPNIISLVLFESCYQTDAAPS